MKGREEKTFNFSEATNDIVLRNIKKVKQQKSASIL